jgi:hypothetical protein
MTVASMAVLASAAPALVIHQRSGHFLGIELHHGINPASVHGSPVYRSTSSSLTAASSLAYHGGPVIHSSVPHLIFWIPSGESLPSSSQSLMARYLTDVAAASGTSGNVFGVDRQFTDQSGFADYRQTFSAPSDTIVDTHSYPTSGRCKTTAPAYPECLTDVQLQNELSSVVTARGLPRGTGPNAPLYFIVTPADVNVCVDASECASNTFCAYHSDFSQGGNQVLYAAIPFFLSTNSGSPQYAKSCQQDGANTIQEPNGNLADVAISYMSHEQNEMLTDPLGSAWSSDSTGNEDGDNCVDAYAPSVGGNASSGTLYDQLINGHPYYTQAEWSNGGATCNLRPSPGTLGAAFSVPTPGSAPPSVPATFNPASTSSTYPISSTTWGFNDGSAPAFATGAGALAQVSHTYSQIGRHAITLTAVDDRGNLAAANEQVVVGNAPTATFTSSPKRVLSHLPVRFNATRSSDPNAGVLIGSYQWRFGDGSSAAGPRPSHSYRRAGTYRVTLIVTDSLGITGASSHVIRVSSGIARITVQRRALSATVLVKVERGGNVSANHRTIHLRRAGTARFRIVLSAARIHRLERKHILRLRLRVRYVSSAGAASVKTVKITFRT